MQSHDSHEHLARRDFLKTSAIAAATTATMATGAAKAADKPADGLDYRNHRPDVMQYRTLGRTKFVCSRLVFGGGAALSGGRAVRLLDRAFEAGINHYDLGSNAYYKQAENAFAEFYKANRGHIWVTSKAPTRPLRLELGHDVSVEQAQAAAKQWSELLDQSLKDMQTDYVDAYYIMMVDQPSLVKSEEMKKAFDAAKAAGKVGHFGISTHTRAQGCLEAAIDAGFYDLAMIALSPAGWYSPISAKIEKDSPTLKDVQPLLARAREAGIGLVGMKAGRFLSAPGAEGKGNATAFDSFYGPQLMQAAFSPFQRAYAYVLENGIDVVNADMQNFAHLEENLVAAKTSHEYLA
jgi:aryl-alcohol dehydrogenase-like predicted oxidoreductase